MEHLRERNVVVGAGAVGAATAYHLARRGEPVLLVEQFALGHDRGSSHGTARIIRHSYSDAFYARLMPEAFRAWRQLEADAGINLYLRTGGISFCPTGIGYVAEVAANLEMLNVPHRRMTGRELGRSWPVFQVPDDTDVVFEPDAGMLAASRAVAVQVELARRLGGERTRVREQTPVRRIDLESGKPTLVTDTATIVADRLIVTAGAWVGGLFPRLAPLLRPTRQKVLYLRPDDAPAFEPGRFPVFIAMGATASDAFYGMPAFLGMGVKAARHGGPETDPAVVDREVGEADRERVRAFLRGCLPALAEARIEAAETCLYTVAPDEHFRIDEWPGRSDVLVASPCSGHGFKFSCLVGRLLTAWAVDGMPPADTKLWQIA